MDPPPAEAVTPSASWPAEFNLQAEKNSPSASSPRVTTTIPDANSVEEGGRTYHGYRQGRYFLPNDGIEQDRLDLQHHIFRLILDGRLYLAPIGEKPENVLDVATGTGIWALDFAEEHPDAHVIGTDLSMIQPNPDIANCEFVREDSEEPWVHDRSFDYIHMRAVVTCFTDMTTVIRHSFQHLKPGGWIELQDFLMDVQSIDGTIEGTALRRISVQMHKGLLALGRDVHKPLHYRRWLLEAGFVDVTEYRFPLPCSPWPVDEKFKKLGLCHQANSMNGLQPMATKSLPAIGLSPDEVQALLERAIKDLGDLSLHPFVPVYFVFGRKPHPEEVKPHGEPTPAATPS